MKKKKLLHITSSLKRGGAEVLLCDIIEKLGDKQFEHHVAYFHPGPHVKRLEAMGVRLYHLHGFFFLYDPLFFVQLFRLFKAVQPDCIHSLLWAANVTSRVIAKCLSIPHISAYHIHINQDGAVRKLLDIITLRFADKMVAVSQDVANSFLPAVPAKKKKNVSVIENGIDARAIRAKAKEHAVARQTLGLSKEHFVIGTVGRFAPRKNFPLLLESFVQIQKKFPHTRLVIVGTGPDEQKLKTYAQQLGVQETAVFVVNQPAYGYFPLFDCFVQPSDKEGLSIALLEAMSFGIPCTVVETTRQHPVIRHRKNGLVVGKSDRLLLARQIFFLIQNVQKTKELGAAGRADAESRFSVNRMVNSYRQLFLKISNRNC